MSLQLTCGYQVPVQTGIPQQTFPKYLDIMPHPTDLSVAEPMSAGLQEHGNSEVFKTQHLEQQKQL